MNTSQYAAGVAELLAIPSRMPLGPGTPDRSVSERLSRFDVKADFAPTPVRDAAMSRACLAGLWLRFNHLDESHAVSQGLDTPEGSIWHAVLHRREPDPGNSKYWWRRVGSHQVIEQLAQKAPALGYDYTDPFAFVDLCERVRGTGGASEKTAEEVQALEWQLLFDWCYRKATE